MTFLTFDMCLAAPLTHSHSSEKDVDRMTGLQGVSTNNMEVLLSGGPLPGDELDVGAFVWLAFTVRWEVGLLSCATGVFLCSAPCRATILSYRYRPPWSIGTLNPCIRTIHREVSAAASALVRAL